MCLIVGLGNPGAQYAHTRHNVGFDVVGHAGPQAGRDHRAGSRTRACLANASSPGKRPSWPSADLHEPERRGRLPSGALVPPASGKNLMVVYDDVDLPPGSHPHPQNGSAGTHNGMRSIIGPAGVRELSPA